jgi:hypothetical protein
MTAMLALRCCLCAAAGCSTPATPWSGIAPGEGSPLCDDCRTGCYERAAQNGSTLAAQPVLSFMGIVVTVAPEKPADTDDKIIDFRARRRARIAARTIGRHCGNTENTP